MSDDKLSHFANQKYLSLETFRKNGVGVATPMWFAEGNGEFYVYTLAGAGKVKRIRNNPRVRVAPCDLRGNVTGQWTDATARIVDAAEAEKGQSLLNQKYGLLKRIGDFFSRLRKRKQAVIAIRVA